MKTETHTITPALADKILREHNNQNPRRVNALNANEYARDMKLGKWQLTHQGLAFTGDSLENPGELVDGQTRLTAVTISQCDITMRCTFGAVAHGKIDFGRKRSITCVTGIPKEQVAICYAILNAIRCNGWGISHVELLTERFPRLYEIAQGVQKVKGLTNSQVQAAFAVAHESGISSARRWYRELAEVSPLMPQPINSLYRLILFKNPTLFSAATNRGGSSLGYICALRAIHESNKGNAFDKFYPERIKESLSDYDGVVGSYVREFLV